MRVVLIGASGFVGSKILDELTDRGHSVKAIARRVDKIPPHDHTEIEAVDVFKTDQLVNTINAADAVVSAYNAGWQNPDLYRDFLAGSKAIEKAVQLAGVKHFIVIGGAGSLYDGDNRQLVDAPGFPEQFKPGALAARDYLNELKQNTSINWTYFSPAIEMNPSTSGMRKGSYRTGLEHPVFDENNRSVISAEDVAVAIVDELEEPRFVQKRFTAAY